MRQDVATLLADTINHVWEASQIANWTRASWTHPAKPWTRFELALHCVRDLAEHVVTLR